MMSARTPSATTRGAQTATGGRPVRERRRGDPLRVRRSVAVSEPFEVSRFVLFSSRASVGGGPYVVEAAYPLED